MIQQKTLVIAKLQTTSVTFLVIQKMIFKIVTNLRKREPSNSITVASELEKVPYANVQTLLEKYDFSSWS